MKHTAMLYTLAVTLAVTISVSPAWAEPIPDWVKTSAGWWADGMTTDAEFVAAIQHLISIGVIVVEPVAQTTSEQSDSIPDWVKTSAGWWADGVTSDAEFVAAIQHLIKTGIIHVETPDEDPRLAELQRQLEECAEYTRAYERLDCEKAIEQQITRIKYETEATPYAVGPVTYYYPGAHLEITESGQALLTIQMMAANDGTDNVTLSCTGPSICNYDITDGTTAYKYAATDFTSGSITIKPGEAKEFEMLFGPNVGYGGSTFVYDPAKQYHFRINESFGSTSILLEFE